MIGDTWYPIASMRNLNFIADDSKHKSRCHQLNFIVVFLQANVNHRVFVKLDSRYGEYFPEYANYFGRPLTNYGKIFSDELTNWLIYEVGFKQSQWNVFTYYKYKPDRSELVVSSYLDDFVYWYTLEELGNWFMHTLRNIFHVNLLGYAH